MYRRETGGVDGEERDLVDLGAEEGDLRRGEREPAVAGGELQRGVDEEGSPRRKGDCEGEPVGALDRGVGAR